MQAVAIHETGDPGVLHYEEADRSGTVETSRADGFSEGDPVGSSC